MKRPRYVKSARGLYEPVITEENVLGAIRGLLELNGARVHRIVERIPYGKRTSEPGIPDLMVIWPHMAFQRVQGSMEATHAEFRGLVTFVEVKRPGGKLRPAQAAWIEQAQRDGVIAFKADSVEECVREFMKYGIEIKGL